MSDLVKLRELARAATPGPWHWAGNTDTGEPYLATWTKGLGRCQVLAIGKEDRDPSGREAERMRASIIDCGYDAGEADEAVRDWALDRYGSPRTDARLEFVTDLMCVKARDLAVYEVAPNATSREDPDVYRADVLSIRHPDAEYIAAASPDVVLGLLDELQEARRELDANDRKAMLQTLRDYLGMASGGTKTDAELWEFAREALADLGVNGEPVADDATPRHAEHITVEAWPAACHEGDCDHVDEDGEPEDMSSCPPLDFVVCVDCMDERDLGRNPDGWGDSPLDAWPHPGSEGWKETP